MNECVNIKANELFTRQPLVLTHFQRWTCGSWCYWRYSTRVAAFW